MNQISKEQVLAIEHQLLEAVKSSHVAQLELLLHNDLRFHLPNGAILTKAMDLEAHRAGNMVVESIAARDYDVSIIGDTAIVSVLIETSGKIFEQPMAGSFRYLRLWKLFGDSLKVIGGSCIKVA